MCSRHRRPHFLCIHLCSGNTICKAGRRHTGLGSLRRFWFMGLRRRLCHEERILCRVISISASPMLGTGMRAQQFLARTMTEVTEETSALAAGAGSQPTTTWHLQPSALRTMRLLCKTECKSANNEKEERNAQEHGDIPRHIQHGPLGLPPCWRQCCLHDRGHNLQFWQRLFCLSAAPHNAVSCASDAADKGLA